ncbi:MAG: class I SAM-dependent rRNA methyltransferase [Spirochaetaceae bacterium]|nr:class I SAM-dependent rRNA methyltransferase [Spirochaetaceae bacterium]
MKHENRYCTCMAVLVLKPKEDIRIRRGHPWVYDNEIARTLSDPAPGDEVEVQDARGLTVGYAFYNPSSRIRARIYSKQAKHADLSFFLRAFEKARAWRLLCFGEDALTHGMSLRIVFGEADGVPGLVVDAFAGIPLEASASTPALPQANQPEGLWLSAQFLSLGVELRKEHIVAALREVFKPDGIVERSDAPVRALEGLQPSAGVLWGTVPPRILITENNAFYEVDLLGGQKTGWFLDQRANRAAAARYAPGARVLDMFCNQGGFSISAAKAGAAAVLAVDSSREALELLHHNAVRNGVSDRIEIISANAFDYLRELEKMGRRFDLVILDPPAFAKNRAALEGARRGYKELNLRGMRLLERGGILATFSCSHWFDDAMFDSMLLDAAHDCNRTLRLLEQRNQDVDHPIVYGYEESRYLKGRILQVL